MGRYREHWTGEVTAYGVARYSDEMRVNMVARVVGGREDGRVVDIVWSDPSEAEALGRALIEAAHKARKMNSGETPGGPPGARAAHLASLGVEPLDERDAMYLPAYVRIARTLRVRVAEGAYAPGTALPGEHALAAEFGVSRPTIVQALGHLKDAGVVESRQGAGTFVVGQEAP
jgi:hypothetical protein